MKGDTHEESTHFCDNKQWAISVDDGCLRFHPDFNGDSEKTTSWIWKEAFDDYA